MGANAILTILITFCDSSYNYDPFCEQPAWNTTCLPFDLYGCEYISLPSGSCINFENCSIPDVTKALEEIHTDPASGNDSSSIPDVTNTLDGIQNDPASGNNSSFIPNVTNALDGIQTDPPSGNDSSSIPDEKNALDGTQTDPSSGNDSNSVSGSPLIQALMSQSKDSKKGTNDANEQETSLATKTASQDPFPTSFPDEHVEILTSTDSSTTYQQDDFEVLMSREKHGTHFLVETKSFSGTASPESPTLTSTSTSTFSQGQFETGHYQTTVIPLYDTTIQDFEVNSNTQPPTLTSTAFPSTEGSKVTNNFEDETTTKSSTLNVLTFSGCENSHLTSSLQNLPTAEDIHLILMDNCEHHMDYTVDCQEPEWGINCLPFNLVGCNYTEPRDTGCSTFTKCNTSGIDEQIEAQKKSPYQPMFYSRLLVGRSNYQESKVECDDGKECLITYKFDNECAVPLNAGHKNCQPPCKQSDCEYEYMPAMCPKYACSYPSHTLLILGCVSFGVLLIVTTFLTAFCCLRRTNGRIERIFPFFTRQDFSPDIESTPLMDEDEAEQQRIIRTREGQRRAEEFLTENVLQETQEGAVGFTTAEIHAIPEKKEEEKPENFEDVSLA